MKWLVWRAIFWNSTARHCTRAFVRVRCPPICPDTAVRLSADNPSVPWHFEEMAQPRGLRAIGVVGTPFAIYTSKASITHLRRDDMKFETVMLKGFFAAGLLVCVLALTDMLTTHAAAPQVIAATAVAAVHH